MLFYTELWSGHGPHIYINTKTDSDHFKNERSLVEDLTYFAYLMHIHELFILLIAFLLCGTILCWDTFTVTGGHLSSPGILYLI